MCLKSAVAKLSGFVCGLTLGLVCLEAGLRIMSFPWLERAHQPRIYQPDPVTGYRYIPDSQDRILRNAEIDSQVMINHEGFHDVNHVVADKGTVRVLAVGDSFTAAIHVPVEKTWTRQLESQLNASSALTWQVFNVGLDGTGTDAHLNLLREQIARKKPDIVIIAFYENDISDSEKPLTYRLCYEGNVIAYRSQSEKDSLVNYINSNNPGRLIKLFYERSYIMRLAIAVLARLPKILPTSAPIVVSNYISPSLIGEKPQPSNVTRDPAWKHLRVIRGLSQYYGFSLLIVPVPAKSDINESYNKLLDHISDSGESFPEIFNIEKYFTKALSITNMQYGDMFWKYDGHFNEAGNMVMASALRMLMMENEAGMHKKTVPQ